MAKKKLAVAAVLFVVLIIASVVCSSVIQNSWNTKWDDNLILESLSAVTYGDNITGGTLVISNPTQRAFENLTFNLRIDDSQLITPYLRLVMPLSADPPFANYSIPITKVSIDPSQNMTLQVLLYNPDQNTPAFYNASVTAQTYSPHTIAVYLTQSSFGDIIDGQTFPVPQRKAYLQIVGYSPVEHSQSTWHRFFNTSTQRDEYINDQRNYLQTYSKAYYPLDHFSYIWAKAFNQIGEHYFNITLFNNSTFTVNRIAVTIGNGGTAYAHIDKMLQPNETYSFLLPVALDADVDYKPVESSASGDIVG
jgi:hypothetical protein